jgi:hypothetical protein
MNAGWGVNLVRSILTREPEETGQIFLGFRVPGCGSGISACMQRFLR